MISPAIIKAYLENKFKNQFKLSSGGRELVIPSIFMENDWKRHMSINIETGMWQCFKSGNRGNFIKLYSLLEECKYSEAETKLIFKTLWDTGSLEHSAPKNELPPAIDVEALYDSAESITPQSLADNYMRSRRLYEVFPETPRAFSSGSFSGRIPIPFRVGTKLFFFQARTFVNHPAKYKNPPNLYSGNFLYPYKTDASYVVVCEGPIDAITLNGLGINATCTMGTSVTRTQMEFLSTFGGKIILGYNQDEAGKKGVLRFNAMRNLLRLPKFYQAQIPLGVKDWNEAFLANRVSEIKESIDKATPFDSILFELNDLKIH